jgi:hypothetical protein
MKSPDGLSLETFINENMIRFAVVMIAVPFSSLSDSTLSILQKVSFDYGVTIIASYSDPDNRIKPLFGIKKFKGGRNLWPLKAKIDSWPGNIKGSGVIVDYGLGSGFSGKRKGDLKKLSLKNTLAKFMKLIQSSRLPFARLDLEPGATVHVTSMQNEPLAWSYRFGMGTNYFFALDGNKFLNRFNDIHRFLRTCIEVNSGNGMVSTSLEGAMVLRIDDPGACSTDYLDTKGTLEEDEWDEIGNFIRERNIPLNVMYTPGWVDDGDRHAGRLLINNREVLERTSGTLYDSARVKYISLRKNNHRYNHTSEFIGINELVKEGCVDIHSHGLTHLTPDYEIWSRSKTKHSDYTWYREFWGGKSGKGRSIEAHVDAMEKSRMKIAELFDNSPLVITPSDHKHSANCDLLARYAGYRIFSSDYTGILKDDMVIRNWKIPAVYLYLKDPTPFALRSGYPFVGVIHDYDVKKGLGELEDILTSWSNNGIKRFITFKDLALNLCSNINVLCVDESFIKIKILLPVQSEIAGAVSEINGAGLSLRVKTPYNTIPKTDLLSIAGATVNNVIVLEEESALILNLTMRNDPVVFITLPILSKTKEERTQKSNIYN